MSPEQCVALSSQIKERLLFMADIVGQAYLC